MTESALTTDSAILIRELPKPKLYKKEKVGKYKTSPQIVEKRKGKTRTERSSLSSYHVLILRSTDSWGRHTYGSEYGVPWTR